MANGTIPLFVLQNEKRTPYRQRKLLENLSDFEIIKNCGMPFWAVREFIEIFQLMEGTRSTAISLETKVLTYLSYLRSGNFQWSMGTLSGTSQATVSRIIQQATTLTMTLAESEIKFSDSLESSNIVKQKFFQIANVPNIIGVVDGTHVGIRAPTKDEPIFVNRKQYHSINCQVVADSEYRFLDVIAKWPGSTHDSFIWRNSSTRERIRNGSLGPGWLLGDSGYPLEPWLLVPYQNNCVEINKRKFNRAFKKTRSVIERAIGNWKSRFRSMCKTGGISCYEEGKLCKLIVSSCVLHNICVNKEIPLSAEDAVYRDDEVIPGLEAEEDNQAPPLTQQQERSLGDVFRSEITDQLP